MTIIQQPFLASSVFKQQQQYPQTMSAPQATVEEVLRVLEIFLDPTGQGANNKEIDVWLKNFQKKPEAWGIADHLLRSETVPVRHKLFAAQTIRQKIESDWGNLDGPSQASLRDSLLQVLYQQKAGPRPIVTQLCLSLADIAIQMHDWEDPVRQLIGAFGKDQTMIGPLLEFLAVLPEEFMHNRIIQLDEDEANGRAEHILRSTAGDVLNLLMFHHTNITSPGGDVSIKKHILDCLQAWVRSGDLSIDLLPSTAVIGLAFDALEDDNLTSVATDLICEIIYRTGNVKQPRPLSVIHAVYSRLLPLRATLEDEKDDPEAVRDLCLIFAAAGETWADLIGTNHQAFKDVLDGLLQCAAYEDLDIAKITFLSWERIKEAAVLEVNAAARPYFIPIYSSLVQIIIKQLEYPADLSWSAEERDNFRDFRHTMGDVLKDAVQVMGGEAALGIPYAILCSLCSGAGTGAFDASATWQSIEAPLFSLRAMCRAIDTEVSVLPKIMDMLPQLPQHPKIKYAAILVIGRYAEWTAKHPEYIAYQMAYVSQGFEDKESIAAAAQSLKYLSRECAPHLVPHLEQLHDFFFQTIGSMDREDADDVTQAIAHIVSAVPLPQLAGALQKFCHPIAERLHQLAAAPTAGDDSTQVKEVLALLRRLGTLLKYSTPPLDTILSQDHPSIAVISEIWPIIDLAVTRFAAYKDVEEEFARLCNVCMSSYKQHLLPVLSPIMTKVVGMFNQTGTSCYLWTSSRCVREYGDDDSEAGKAVFALVESLTASTFQIISSKVTQLDDIPDVIEDYFQLASELIEQSPSLFCSSSLLPSLFSCAATCLTVQQNMALRSVITFLRDMLDCAIPGARVLPQLTAEPLVAVVKTGAGDLVRRVFYGLIHTFPRERELYADVAGILKSASDVARPDVEQAVRLIVSEYPDEQLPAKEKETFLLRYKNANDEFKDSQKLATVMRDFVASFRRRNGLDERRRPRE
ncbi:Nuclear import receptor [Geranomyces michiganensis]|nr:Nuclear import receptor [Geranomyces michiganensis]